MNLYTLRVKVCFVQLQFNKFICLCTGHGFNNWTEVIQGPIDSLYLRLWQRNHCNHRDYQNIGVNGIAEVYEERQ